MRTIFMEPGGIVGLVIAIIVLVGLAVSGIKIVKQTEKLVIERVGKFHSILDPGVHWIWPFFDRVALRVVMKEQIRDFDPQPVSRARNRKGAFGQDILLRRRIPGRKVPGAGDLLICKVFGV